MSDIIHQAQRRINQVRRTPVDIRVMHEGKPVADAQVRLRMKNHQYLFGAVCYQYGKYPTPQMNQRFTTLFTGLFNYTMMPFHWSWYEPQKGEYAEPYTGNLVRWAAQNHLKKKLHALIWHELCPDWVSDTDDVKALYTQRITHLMETYGDDFDFFDVANETTVNDRFDNPVSRWVRAYGPIDMVRFGVDLVRSLKPDAQLLYGDWNVHGDDYLNFLRDMRGHDIDIDILGVQSHMHIDRWSHEKTMATLEKIAAFGWPIHFPECSVCSGYPIGETNFGAGAVNHWTEPEEALYSQAEFARDFYTLVFSHPATEALSWFDFTDHRWLNAPAGVVTEDLQPKPIYHTLHDLIHHQWHSDADLVTASNGLCAAHLFFGSYDITVTALGKTTHVSTDILRERFYAGGGQPRLITLALT